MNHIKPTANSYTDKLSILEIIMTNFGGKPYKGRKHGHNKFRIYKKNKTMLSVEHYVRNIMSKKYRSAFAKFRRGVAPIRIETGRYEGMEEKGRICLLCDHNIIESECHVSMSCPAYNELLGELLTHAAQFESNFNNLNDDEKFVLLFSATDVFIRRRPALIFLLAEEKCCILLDRKY